ncbi:MAG TPA: GAF domain-containing sensor histidine kinase [Pseudonocardiaceae bacterium]
MVDGPDQLRQREPLVDAVLAVGTGLDLDATLKRLVASAIDLVDARSGSFGLIGDDPPPSATLSVPVTVRNTVFGTLHLTGDGFSAEDRSVLKALVAAAGIAVENVLLYEESQRRQRWSEATSEIITQLLAGNDPGDALQDIADRTLELSSADHTLIAVPEDTRPAGDELSALSVAVSAGFGPSSLTGLRIPIGSTAGAAFQDPVPRSVPALDFDPLPGAQLGPALMLPLRAGDRVLGVLVAVRRAGAPVFDTDELPVIASFADQAALALQLANNQWHLRELDVLADRDRIARDLHDHVIQRLFGVGLALQGTHRRVVSPEVAGRISDSVDQLHEIVNEIRTAIFDLHADTGGVPRLRKRLHGAITELTRDSGPHTSVRLAGPLDLVPVDLAEHAEAVVREAVSNAVRHAAAAHLSVAVSVRDDLVIEVTDDGVGLPESIVHSGLTNLRQRAERAGGTFIVDQVDPRGTRLRWTAPLP